MSETEVPDQLKSFISDEVSRQLRERGSILNAMKEQMAKVLEEFEDMAANVNSKRSWSNSVAKTKPSMSSPKKSSLGTSAAATSPPRLPKISDGILKNIHQFKQDASEETLPSNNVGHRSPNGKIVFDKILPRVANIEKRGDGSQIALSQQRQQTHERALVRYPQCRSNVFAPSVYDHEEATSSDTNNQKPRTSLELDFVYGFRSGITSSSSSNQPATNSSINSGAYYLSTGEIMWYTASVVILYKKETNTQRYFREHTNEVTSVAVHPNQRIVASGQAGRSAFLLVWNANDELLGKRFACLKGHQIAVRSISFSHDGKLIVSLGSDMYNTICIHDWKSQQMLVSTRGHTFRVHIVAFNPFQAYGRPDTHRSKKPGQALHDDDVCYTLVSCGVRHIRFWTLTKVDYVPPLTQENADSAYSGSTFGGPPRLRPPTPKDKVWKLEGNVPSFHGRFEVQDFISLAFVNDSPSLCIYDEHTKELIVTNVSDHSMGRVVAGTAKGDLCLFLQPRLSPDIAFIPIKDHNKEPAKWWEIPDEYTDAEVNELVLEKIAYEPAGMLIDVVPHDQETGNRFKLPRQAQAEIEGLSKKITMYPNLTSLHSRLDELKYCGPLAHQGAAYQVAYSRKLNMVMSSGHDGRLLLWMCQMSKPVRIPGVSLNRIFTPLTGSYSEGSHALLPLDDPDKIFRLPTALPGEKNAGGAPVPKPTSIVWKEDGHFVLVGTSTSCIWELNIVSGDWRLVFEARNGTMTVCSAHPLKEEVATLSQDAYLCFWNVQNHACVRRLYLGSYITSNVKAVCMDFHPSGDEVAIGLSSGELLIVDSNALVVLHRKNAKSNSTNLQTAASNNMFRSIAQVKFCPRGKYLALGVKDTFAYIYDAASGYTKLHVCEGHSSAVVHLTWSSGGDILQSNTADGEILHWLISPTKGEAKQITDAFVVRDVEWIKWTCVFGWPTPGIWSEDSPNLADIAEVCTTGPKTASDLDGAATSTSDEDLLAVACRSSVHLLKCPARRGAKRKVYKVHSGAIASLCFSFDDAYLVTVGGDDGTLIQWKLTSTAGSPYSESVIEQRSASSPTPPPIDNKPRSSRQSPRQHSRQYRERQSFSQEIGNEITSGLNTQEAEDDPEKQQLDIENSGDDFDHQQLDTEEGEQFDTEEREVMVQCVDEVDANDLDSARNSTPYIHSDELIDSNRDGPGIVAYEALPTLIQVRATHDYISENPDELSLSRGEIVRVLSKADGEWWLGESCDGAKGYFPFNFVEEIDLSVSVSGDEAVEDDE